MRIDLKTSVKDQMVISTQNEIQRLLAIGVEQIHLVDMESLLKGLGLKLDFNTDSHCYYYYNNLNQGGSWYEMTTSPLDEKGISVYNVGSEFYQKHLGEFPSEKGIELRKLRNNFFCLKRYRGTDYIVSF